MRASRDWVKRNLGFDPIATPAPAASFAHKVAATPRARARGLPARNHRLRLRRTRGRGFFRVQHRHWALALHRYPVAEKPRPEERQHGPQGRRRRVAQGRRAHRDLDRGRGSRAEPRSDAGQGLPQRLRPVQAQLREDFQEDAQGCPALQAGRLGAYWTMSIGGKKVVIFKSDSHLSQDMKRAPTPGQTLPNEDVWRQIIAEVNPKLVITTGTAGGIGTQCEVGDVVVSPIVRFDCHEVAQEGAVRTAAVYLRRGEDEVLRQCQEAVQGQRRAAARRTTTVRQRSCAPRRTPGPY